MEFFEDVNWPFVMLFWIPISIGIWKAYAKSEVMGSIGFRLVSIIAMFFLIILIIKKMGD